MTYELYKKCLNEKKVIWMNMDDLARREIIHNDKIRKEFLDLNGDWRPLEGKGIFLSSVIRISPETRYDAEFSETPCVLLPRKDDSVIMDGKKYIVTKAFATGPSGWPTITIEARAL